MGRLIPFGSIPDSNVLPEGTFRFKVESLTEKFTKEREGKVSKLMFVLGARVVEPASLKGLSFFENMVIGTDDDPEGQELSTWQTSIGGRSLKKFTKALGIPFSDEEDAETFAATIKGAEYLATLVQKVDDGSKDARYKGQIRNNVVAYWKIGERDIALAEGGTKPAAGARKPLLNGEAKPAPSDEVTCTACRKRVPRKELKTHVESHMRELAEAEKPGAAVGDDD